MSTLLAWPFACVARSCAPLCIPYLALGSFLVSGCAAQDGDDNIVAPDLDPASQSTQASTPASTAQPVFGTFKPTPSTLPLKLPGPAVRRTSNDPRIVAVKTKLQKFPTYAGYRQLAQLYVQNGMYEAAAQTYRTEAAMYRKRGLNDAAQIVERNAERYTTRLQITVEREATAAEIERNYSQARLEPKLGVLLGAFIDRDDGLRRTFRGETWQTHRFPGEFAERIGKPHATHFTYVQYGNRFPRRWLEQCKRDNVIPHIAWEPKSLHHVQNNGYLQGWAKALREYNWPVFIRFAGEMNGAWTPYHGNPVLYRAKFRLVHQVLRSAPRVATIWCVNSVPVENIPNYYPGDDGCDWVGVNLYSVPFYDNDRKRVGLNDSPLPLLDPIYKRYSARKPIAICEYGASHMAAIDRVRRNSFAIEKMTLLYSSLPRLYPRIKMINWFSVNNLVHARPGRQLNNYNLTEQLPILDAYQKVIASPYFLSTPDAAVQPQRHDYDFAWHQPLRDGQKLAQQSRLGIWVKSVTPRPIVVLSMDKAIIYAGQKAGAHEINLDLQQFGDRQSTLTAYVYDEKKRFVTSQTMRVLIE